MDQPDVLVVGAGIFGLTVAERLATQQGKRVLVVDKRDHIGGNAYSEFDTETGIECHKYGAHLFHTSDEAVWQYVNQFTKFTGYVHHVYAMHQRKDAERPEVFPMPVSLGTINQFFRSNYTPDEARELIAEQAKNNPAAKENRQPTNLAEQGISLIGEPLFNAFIKNYTAKQWQTPAEELSPEIIKRLPVRYTYNNRYFKDTYEGLPQDGYEAWFRRMIESGNKSRGSVTVKLKTDYFKDANIKRLRDDRVTTIYTGPIDQFYGYQFGELSWRSLKLDKEVVSVHDFQGCPVMNYNDLEPKFTRIHEFKHFHPERADDVAKWPGYAPDYNKTVIVREYSKAWQQGDEPYYPINTTKDRTKLAKYQDLAQADKSKQIYFGGRLGEYAYYDMDKSFASALKLVNQLMV
ncbi:UDP-galactopyranose mutase [Candidatus Saccharibacteria bacterium]|nr:UDP-galactopyranose mutase [Candidatus Saccharibacteria bacterium]